MKKITKILVPIAFSVALVIGLYMNVHILPSQQALGDIGTIVKINVSKSASVTTASSEILSASSGRTYAIIVNDGANPVYLSIDGNAAVAGQGIRLNASGGSYEINALNQVVASIHAITSSSTSTLTVSASQ